MKRLIEEEMKKTGARARKSKSKVKGDNKKSGAKVVGKALFKLAIIVFLISSLSKCVNGHKSNDNSRYYVVSSSYSLSDFIRFDGNNFTGDYNGNKYYFGTVFKGNFDSKEEYNQGLCNLLNYIYENIIPDEKVIYLDISSLNKDNINERIKYLDVFCNMMLANNLLAGIYCTDSDIMLLEKNYDCSNLSKFIVAEDGKDEIEYKGSYDVCQINNIVKTINNSSSVQNTIQSEDLIGFYEYTIKYGDRLYKIAKEYGVTVKDLMECNGLKSDYIYAGDILYIPVKDLPLAIGPDVSNYNEGMNYDYCNTVDFAIIKISDNNGALTEGQNCAKQVEGFVSNGVPIGFYYCLSDGFTPTREELVEKLGKRLYELEKVLSEKGLYLDKANIPIFLDYEGSMRNEWFTLLEAFVDEANRLGYGGKHGVYASRSHTQDMIDDAKKHGYDFDKYTKWIAGGPDYRRDEDPGIPYMDAQIKSRMGTYEEGTIIQFGNVYQDTGFSINHRPEENKDKDHCDLNGLYDLSIFGNAFSENYNTNSPLLKSYVEKYGEQAKKRQV